MSASKILLFASAILIAPACNRQPSRGANPVGSRRPLPNIVLISVDTLNRNALRCYDSTSAPLPFLDAFASECVRFTQAVAAAPWTLASQASMLTGLYPNHHGATDPRVVLSETVPTLAGELSREYETIGFTNWGFFDPTYGLNRGFGKYVCVSPPSEPAELASESSEDHLDPVFVQATKYVSSRSRGSRPLFLFVQTLAVHNYYQEPLGPEDAPGDKGVFDRNLKWVTGEHACPPETWKQLEAAYARRVSRMNRDFEALVTALKHAGLWDSSVIVFTSDHGEGFQPELGRTHHGGLLYANVLRVPLLIRLPRVTPREETAPVSLIDVMPSLLELTGAAVPAGLDGRSFLALLSDEPATLPTRTLFAMEYAFWWNQGRRDLVEKLATMPLSAAAIRGDRWCIRGGRSPNEANLGPGANEELYDMSKDPGQRLVLSTEPDPLSLEQSVGTTIGGRTRTNLRSKNKELDDQLKRLGYTR